MTKAMYSALSKSELAETDDVWDGESSVIDLKSAKEASLDRAVNDAAAREENHTSESLRSQSNYSKPADSKSKRAFDLLFATLALIWSSPLLLLIFVLVRLDGGKAIFVQQRVGRDSKLFPCYKFRSMVPDAETALKDLLVCNEQFRSDWDAERKLRNDPRITKIGAFLRKKSLDELPQLWNIIRGDMSVVGPRPIVPDELEKYGADMKYYVEAKPGLTGAWQVSGRNDTTYEERVELDVEYTSNWSFWTDLKIIFKTFGVVLSGRGAL